MKPCPCKECTKRYSGCHSKCKEYKEWSEELAEERKQSRVNGEYAAVHGAQMRKAARRKWNKRRK